MHAGTHTHTNRLTKGHDNGASDAGSQADSKDAHGPGVLQTKLELIGLALERDKEQGERG